MTTESEAVFDLLEYVGRQMEGKVEYWDALFDRQSSCSISKDNVDERIALPEFAGIQLRSFKNGVWRSASTYRLEKERLKELALKLVKIRQETKNRVRLHEQKPLKLNVVMKVGKNPSVVDLESKVDDVRNFHKRAANLDKRIINVVVQYGDSRVERVFVDSEGSSMRQIVTRTRLALMPVARENDKIRVDFESLGGTKGYEVVEKCDFDAVA